MRSMSPNFYENFGNVRYSESNFEIQTSPYSPTYTTIAFFLFYDRATLSNIHRWINLMAQNKTVLMRETSNKITLVYNETKKAKATRQTEKRNEKICINIKKRKKRREKSVTRQTRVGAFNSTV